MKKQLILAAILMAACAGLVKASATAATSSPCTLPAVGLFKILNRTGSPIMISTSSGLFCCLARGKNNYVTIDPDEEYWIKKPVLYRVKIKLPVNGSPHARMTTPLIHYPSSKAFWLVVKKHSDYEAATGTAIHVQEQGTSWKCGGERFTALSATK